MYVRYVFSTHSTHGRKQKPVAEAMRELLEAFRLPGEAQQIGRITETFAEIYFAAKPGMQLLKVSSITLTRYQTRSKVRMRSTSLRIQSFC